jgi:hypothetical protein
LDSIRDCSKPRLLIVRRWCSNGSDGPLKYIFDDATGRGSILLIGQRHRLFASVIGFAFGLPVEEVRERRRANGLPEKTDTSSKGWMAGE